MSEATTPPAAIGDLAVEVLERNAADFLEHAPGARAGTDPYHVHQMRVATRRMRGAVRLFKDVLPPDASRLNEELKWFAGQLAPVRDLDVQVERTRATATQLGVSDALVPYARWLEDQARQARSQLTESFESRRFELLARFLQDLDRWPIDASPPVLVDAPDRLRRAWRQFRKRADAIDDQSPTAELHAVRIRAKRLRYTAEFFEEVYGKPLKRLAERVVRMQDLLGNLQDGVVSRQNIHRAVEASAEAWSARTILGLGQLVQREAECEKELRAEFPPNYRRVRRAWQTLKMGLGRAKIYDTILS